MEKFLIKIGKNGKVTLPREIQKLFKKEKEVMIYGDNNGIIIKKTGKKLKLLIEDLEFAHRTEEAWKSYDRGEFKTSTFENFIKELHSL